MTTSVREKPAGQRTKPYAFQAVDAKGKRSKGTIDARDEAQAAVLLRGQNLFPLHIEQTGRGLQMHHDLVPPFVRGQQRN